MRWRATAAVDHVTRTLSHPSQPLHHPSINPPTLHNCSRTKMSRPLQQSKLTDLFVFEVLMQISEITGSDDVYESYPTHAGNMDT